MHELDRKILKMLVEDSRAPFAEIARELKVSRAHVRERVQRLVAEGLIEKFTVIVNPAHLDKYISAFFDLEVDPVNIEEIAHQLAEQPEVVSLYIMSNMANLHMHVLVNDMAALEHFSHTRIFGRPQIRRAHCKLLLTRVKHRRGGPRL